MHCANGPARNHEPRKSKNMGTSQSLPIREFDLRGKCGAHRAPRPAEDARTIVSAIARRAQSDGQAPALVDAGSRTVTFDQLYTSISSFSHRLAHAGIRREDTAPGSVHGCWR